jgi:uncharacterized integral membrane protein (TIGR00698 family)
MEEQKFLVDVQVQKKYDYNGCGFGILLTFGLAVIAGQVAKLPFFSIMGIMIISIILGAIWGNTVSHHHFVNINLGINFSSKRLLRVGIIFLGFRLNLTDILNAGLPILIIDVIVITFTMSFILFLGKLFKTDIQLTTLLAAGTAICGAAAIVAISPIIKGKQEQTAIAVSCIAVLGTVGTLLYIFLFPYLPITDTEYGVLVGATLHELAHVVAAGVPGGNIGSDSAILVKLGRVLLLIPVALFISYFINRKNTEQAGNSKDLPIPWFIFGFLVMSLINTLQWISEGGSQFFLLLSTYLLAMGMAGLGLNIKWADFKKVGVKPVGVAVLGFLALLSISPFLLFIYRLF